MKNRTFKIGELADKTGLTVRTIRYYDEIGLLEPSGRMASGYRLYGIEELERLQKILSLKYLGLRLEEIKECLKDPGYDLSNIIYRQMKQVRAEIELGRELYSRLKMIADHINSSEEISADELVKTIRIMNDYSKYYTKEQLEYLERRKEEVGEDRIKEVQQEWEVLIKKVRAEIQKGTDPASERMQELASRWEGLIKEFTGGNTGIRESLSTMYKNKGPEKASRGMVDEDLSQFIGKAIAERNRD